MAQSTITKPLNLVTETLTGTMGSSQYQGYYYLNLTTSKSISNLVGVVLTTSSAYYPAFWVTIPGGIRVYSSKSNFDVSARLIFMQ